MGNDICYVSDKPTPKSRKQLSSEEELLLKKLAQRIHDLRSKKYSSIENFANEHDLPRSQVGRYEIGVDMQFLSLSRVLKALDISLKDFFADGFE